MGINLQYTLFVIGLFYIIAYFFRLLRVFTASFRIHRQARKIGATVTEFKVTGCSLFGDPEVSVALDFPMGRKYQAKENYNERK